MRLISCVAILLSAYLVSAAALGADAPAASGTRGDRMIAEYFRSETDKLQHRCMSDVKTLADWTGRREEYRQQLLEMLGLDPLPERSDLQATATSTLDHPEFTVEKLHYQSRPHLYVTADLYIPKNLTKPAPAVLYVCGHGGVEKNNIRYGNKVYYQHHATAFARAGYICLIIDTLQLGEIEGIHHGTYNHGMWWWNSRGYSPAGVEAWNCVRALDYLQTRKEVDPKRLAVTGRSGGGAYSWWISAIDDRIACSAPGAGITDLHNHVINGTVEGHCDCMFMVNTYRWDYAMIPALVAPRPLLLVNTDKDTIFPLDGVMRIYWKERALYDLYKKPGEFGLDVGEGPHGDFQNQMVAIQRWFNRKFKNEDPLIDKQPQIFQPEQLRVFEPGKEPMDAINMHVQETFVPMARPPKTPESKEQWTMQRDEWMKALRGKCFRGWPDDKEAGGLDVKEAFSVEKEGVALKAYDFTPQPTIRLRLYIAHRAGLEKPELLVVNALDDQGWTKFLAEMRPGFAEQFKDEPKLPDADAQAFGETKKMFEANKWAFAYFAPRGVGPSAFGAEERRQTQTRRRFMLLGQTLEGMQAWDLRRAVQAVRSLPNVGAAPLWMQGERQMAGVTLYASLFEPDVKRLDLWNLPKSHMEGPHFLNVLRFLDTPTAVAMAAERSKIRLYQTGTEGWEYPQSVAKKLEWGEKQIELRSDK